MKEEIKRIIYSLIGTIVIIVLGVVTAKYINQNWPLSTNGVICIRAISAGLIAWSVFGRLYNFESWKGNSPQEKFKKAWFVITYSIGFYGAILSLLLNAKT